MQGKERLNQWGIKDYVKNIIMILAKIPIWLLQLMFFWLPIQKNKIIIYSLKQHGYSCNLKYLTDYLQREMPDKFEILWIVRREEDYYPLRRLGIPVAMLHSKEHFINRMSSGVVITNDEFYPMFLRRRKQLYINTWHGGINYKKIGYEGLEFTNPIQKLIYKLNNPRPDLFVSGSRSFTETCSLAFGFSRDIFLECGLPRNDILCRSKDAAQIEQIKQRLGIGPEKKVLLYAPTFRKGGMGPREQMDFRKVRAALTNKFGGDWMILVRQHYFVHAEAEERERFLMNVSGYEDTQELLLCSDCLISDYSSCMWDYLLTGNPCFVFAPDLNQYDSQDRSFFIPTYQWPYPISCSSDELCQEIMEFDPELFARRVKQHREKYGSFDTGHACEILTQNIIDRI